jgi:hypothetical protein
MRKLIPLLVVVLGLAGAAQAQENYSLPASAGNVTTLTDLITFTNAQVCLSRALAVGCTQAQVCTAAGVAGGASCTPAAARAANVRVWPNTQPGREEFVTFQIAVPRFADLSGGLPSLKEQVRILQVGTLSQGTKDSACTTLGLPAGCFP